MCFREGQRPELCGAGVFFSEDQVNFRGFMRTLAHFRPIEDNEKNKDHTASEPLNSRTNKLLCESARLLANRRRTSFIACLVSVHCSSWVGPCAASCHTDTSLCNFRFFLGCFCGRKNTLLPCDADVTVQEFPVRLHPSEVQNPNLQQTRVFLIVARRHGAPAMFTVCPVSNWAYDTKSLTFPVL